MPRLFVICFVLLEKDSLCPRGRIRWIHWARKWVDLIRIYLSQSSWFNHQTMVHFIKLSKKNISRRCLSVPLADCIFVKLCGDMRGHVVLWSLSLFVLQRQDRPLNIFPPRQETGCEALFYGWRTSTFYPESPSLNVLRSCNESCWSSSNDWTEMVERLCSKRLARMERAISFQTRGIPKSMFSQKRAFHPADLLATSICINIY